VGGARPPDRHNASVNLDQAREFVRENHRAVLATRRRDGSPQLSPCLVGVDPEGRLEISSNEGRAKVVNLRRDPRASVLVMTDKFFEKRWIQIDGTAEVLALPGARKALIGYRRRMEGDPEDWTAWEEKQRAARAVIILITPERAGPEGGPAPRRPAPGSP